MTGDANDLGSMVPGTATGSGQRHGAQGRNRTTDTVIFSHVLYQLSYLGAGARRRQAAEGGL